MGFVFANWKWLLSGIAFVAYVVVQHVLYLSLIKACREFKEALDQDVKQPLKHTGGFTWLQDVRALFLKTEREGGWVENAPLPREAVIDSLNNEIWRTPKYGALQRWGLAAPLIGVILSALGFMLSPPELTGEVGDIMSKLGPLFVGVFAGALMAIVNQIYLHYAWVELGRVRTKAVRWFDEAIWGTIRQNAHNVLGRAAAETQSAAKSLEASSRLLATCNISYRDSLLELNQQLTHVRSAAQTTAASFDAFTSMVAEMTERLGGSIKHLTSLNAAAGSIANAGTVWNDAAAKMSNATGAIEDSTMLFHETCGKFSSNFEDVHRAMKDGVTESTSGLLSAVGKLTEPLQKLEISIQQMHENTEKHTELSTSLTNAVAHSNQFLTERMALNVDEANLQAEMATRTKAAIECLQQLSDSVGPIASTSTSLKSAASGLNDASGTIGLALKGLLATCNEYSAHCKEFQTTLNMGVTGAATELQSAAKELAQPVKALNTSLKSVAATGNQNAELTQRLENVAKLGERFMQDRAQANTDESARVSRMDGIEKRLDETTQVVSDSAATMRQLQQSLEALVNELKAAREPNHTQRGWFSFLSSRN